MAGQRSAADLRLLLDVLPAGAYICDGDGLITYFNQHAVEIWGRAPKVNDPEDRFCGSFRLFEADGSALRHDQCWTALALQKNQEFTGQEIVIERPDGTRVEVLAHANPLRDERGTLTGAVNILVDITDAKEAEEASAKLAAIVSSAQDAIIGKTLDGIITSWNRGAERLYGYSAEEALGQPISLLLPPDRPAELRSIMARIRRGERVEPYETVRVAKGGRHVDVLLTVSPVRTANGRLVGASSIAHDTTAHKRSEDGQRLLAAAGASLSASLMNALGLEQVARLALPMLGNRCVVGLRQDDGAVAAVAVADLNTGEDKDLSVSDGEAAALERVVKAGQSELHPIVEPEGSQADSTGPGYLPELRPWDDASAMVVPLPARGEILGAMVFANRGTGRRYSARDLALAEELGRRCALAIDNARLYGEAQGALRLRSEVLTSVTHDLKNPLGAISALAQVLDLRLTRGREESLDKVRAGLRDIHERARAMARQLNELIDVAALEAGQSLELHREPTDLVMLARRLASETQTAHRHQVRVISESGELTVELDAPRFERVLRNLLNNAVKYSPEGGTVTVSLSSKEDRSERWAVLSVRDEGVGIPSSDLPAIFDYVRRGTNVSGLIDGTGLGLGAIRQIVRQHGGTIGIKSQEGAGTVVTIRLPI